MSSISCKPPRDAVWSWFGRFLRYNGCFPVHRDDGDMGAVQHAVELVRSYTRNIMAAIANLLPPSLRESSETNEPGDE